MKNQLNSKNILKSTIAETKAASMTKVVVAEDRKLNTNQSNLIIEVAKELAKQT